ncbi:hypothetical protein GF325_02670 [Candidatus Bathyarchaeota archaeon]|nr:hypothetical protein [Candidatus Bathyarchaeota archaeon]
MVPSKKELVTVQQIDGMSTKTPHARELETIGKSVKTFLPRYSRDTIHEVVDEIGGSIDDLEFGEDLTMSFTFFPEATLHVVYYGADEDDDLVNEPDVRFLFSGKRVTWVSSEDLASLADLTMDYVRELLESRNGAASSKGEVKSDLLQRSIMQRAEPFALLKAIDMPDLGEFVDANISSRDGTWIMKKEFFPGITIVFEHDSKGLKVEFAGKKLTTMNDYAKDQLAIFLMNHVLRFVHLRYPGEANHPIIEKAFSFSYLKGHS